MIDPSPRLKKEAARLACDPNHVIMADLILSGYSEAEAFDIAYSEKSTIAIKQKVAIRQRELSSDGYKRVYDDHRATLKSVNLNVELRDKETVAKDLNTLINTTSDPKLKAELLMKLADLQQMKKDASVVDEEPVQFFLPISCERCPLLIAYNSFLAEKNKMLPQEKWNVNVRPDEMQRIVESANEEMDEKRATVR